MLQPGLEHLPYIYLATNISHDISISTSPYKRAYRYSRACCYRLLFSRFFLDLPPLTLTL